MKKFESPKIELIRFCNEDVILTISGYNPTEGNWGSDEEYPDENTTF